jgi:hypothetical protein
MNEILEFLNRYLDAEYEAYKLDIVAKDAESVFEAFTAMNKEYFAKADIQELSHYLHGKNPRPTPEDRKARKAELQRRPLFKISRYGKGKTELYRGYIGFLANDMDATYWNTFFVRKGTKPKIVSSYRIAPGFSSGKIEWEWQGGEKIVIAKLGKPVEILKIQAPVEKACLADYNSET